MNKPEMTNRTVSVDSKQADSRVTEQGETPAVPDEGNWNQGDLLGEVFAGLSSLA